MKIALLSHQEILLFKESILPKLSPLQKKIAIIAVALFSWIAICYIVVSKRLQLSKPKTSIDQLTTIFKRSIPPSYLNFNEGIFLVKAQYNDKIIKQQYLFKKEEDIPYKMSLTQEIDKIGIALKTVIPKEAENTVNFDWFFLIKKDADKFYQLEGNYESPKLPQSQSTWDVHMREGEEALEMSIINLNQMSIDPKTIIKENKFYPGEYYKDIKNL